MADVPYAAPDALSAASSPQPAQPPVVVKKYANRRLYNTETSSYITLDNLADMIRAGRDFVVYDAKSGEDITRGVLTQIIVEEESKGTSMLPTPFLRQLIGFYGGSLQGVVPRYLETAMSSFARQQQHLRQAMQQTMSLFNPFHRGGEPLPPAPAMEAPAFETPALKTPALRTPDADAAELDRLRHEVESLRAELATARADASSSPATQVSAPDAPQADEPAPALTPAPAHAETPVQVAADVLANPALLHLDLPSPDIMVPPAGTADPVTPLRLPKRTRSGKGMN